jgi:hypothetical protein
LGIQDAVLLQGKLHTPEMIVQGYSGTQRNASIGKITILLGQLQVLKEHCSEMIINKTIEEEMK